MKGIVMEKKEFKDFLKKYLSMQGFEKIKNKFYRNGKGFLCEISVVKSYYDELYYFEYAFYLGTFEKPYLIDRSGWQTATPSIGGRFIFSQKDGYQWGCYYQDYNEEKMLIALEENLNRVIYPPFKMGKIFLLENFGRLYETWLDDEKIKKLLSE